MKSPYTVAEFAELAGVTVKALHHYDRLGLFRPRRSSAGYRLYVAADLERLEQIVALKSIGLRLDQIRTLLDGDAQTLAATLRTQREALESKRGELTRSIRAIAKVEATVSLYRALSRGGVLSRLIEAIELQNDLDALKRYFQTDAAWDRARRYFEEWPSESWRSLFREIQQSLGEDPASAHAASLVERWSAQLRDDSEGDFAFRAGLWRALHCFADWPDSLKRPVAAFDFAALQRFVAEVAWARVGPDGRFADADPKRAPDRVSATKISLFRDLAASLDVDPDGAHTQELMARWQALVDDELGGNPELKARFEKSVMNARRWPEGYKRYVASLYDTTVDQWVKVADALARARSERGHLLT